MKTVRFARPSPPFQPGDRTELEDGRAMQLAKLGFVELLEEPEMAPPAPKVEKPATAKAEVTEQPPVTGLTLEALGVTGATGEALKGTTTKK